MPGASRQSDELLLSMLRSKCLGTEWPEVARRHGKRTWVTAQVACLRVKQADLAESGEPPEIVLKGYWK